MRQAEHTEEGIFMPDKDRVGGGGGGGGVEGGSTASAGRNALIC